MSEKRFMKGKSELKITYFPIICFLLIVCNASSILGIGPVHIGKLEGLPEQTINITVQDKDDYLWIGSNRGLFRFDGKDIKRTTNPDLDSANVTAGFLDSRGFLWIGTYKGSLYVYDGLVFKSIRVPAWFGSSISEIKAGTKGTVLVISRSNGILEYTSQNEFMAYMMGEEKFLIYSTEVLDNRTLLAGTESGLKKITIGGQILKIVPFGLVPETKITQVVKSEDGESFWIVTEDQGVYQISNKGEGKILYHLGKENRFPTNINCIAEEGNSILWIGTKEDGIIKVTFGRTRNSIINIDKYNTGQNWDYPTITDIFRDREGNTWVSTFNDGLLKFENEIFTYFYGQGKLVDDNVLSLERDAKDNFWVGTASGLYQLNFNDSRWSINELASLNLIPADKINALYLDSSQLYVGTSTHGLYRFDTKNFTSKKIDFGTGNLENCVKCIEKVGTDQMWIGTADGIFILDLKTSKISRLTTANGLPHNSINDIQYSESGKIWIAATENKIAYFENSHVKLVTNKKFDVTDINEICKDDKGNIWFASNGHGLFKYDGIHFEKYDQKNGLASDYCYSVQSDINGRIWVSHQQGVSSLDPKTKMAVTYVGLLGSSSFDFTVNRFFKGHVTIWLCTDRGVLRYSETNEKLARQEPKILIDFVKADSTSYDPRGLVSLPYDSYNLIFQFSGLSLKSPAAVKYKYMLKGHDAEWSELSPANMASYSSIYDGEYEFMVKACNEFGVWTTVPATVKLSIKKPYFKEWWFYLLLIVLSILGIYVFINLRTRKLIMDKKKLESIVLLRTRELEIRNQEIIENKNEIERNAKNITDSIKYAKRIQKAIYPTTGQFKKLLPESFIFFKSKGIVSGDFYWIEEKGNKVLFAACDCTGHGVPGAFISIVTNNLLNQAVKEHGITKPSLILDEVNKGITITLHQTIEDATVKDGMDAALCCYDRSTGMLEFAGAYNSLFLFRKGELIEFKADNIPIGRFIGEAYRTFTNHEIITQTGDVLYLFSDGFADQFGGPEGKKIKKNNFKKLLHDVWSLPMEEQREKLYNFFKSWQGELEQVDDVLVIGVRLKNI